MPEAIFLNSMGLANALGADKETVLQNLISGSSPGMGPKAFGTAHDPFFVGSIQQALPEIPPELVAYDCRNNRLSLLAAQQIEKNIQEAKSRYSPERIGVVLGTSTSGIDEASKALAYLKETGVMPDDYHYERQEVGACSEFLALYFALKGPAYTVSTACSSSGKVFASGRGLIESGICDAVIVGGVDTLCQLTLLGFASLEAISDELTNPFSINRKGINIGEASALFLMSREPVGPTLLGVGESSDAYHMSAPEPSGSGALACMTAALSEARLEPDDIQYINLHGTGTRLNDSMESLAVYELFGKAPQCSSTKALTGHTLGAAGATEAGLCWLLLNHNDPHLVAPHIFDGQLDPDLAHISLCTDSKSTNAVTHMMSNSFAFGGNNVSVILGRNTHD